MRRLTCSWLLFAALASGCTGARYQMPKVDLAPGEYQVLGESEATAVGIHLFQLFPINLNDRFARAVEEAITKRGGDALVNISVQESWFWGYVLHGYRTSVQGTVVKRR